MRRRIWELGGGERGIRQPERCDCEWEQENEKALSSVDVSESRAGMLLPGVHAHLCQQLDGGDPSDCFRSSVMVSWGTLHTHGKLKLLTRSAVQGRTLMSNIQVRARESTEVIPPAAQRTFNPQKCVTESQVSVTFPPRAPSLGAEGILH